MMAKNKLIKPQHKPKKNKKVLPNIWDLVVADMKARDKDGFKKYGVHLQPWNGRKGLVDLYQELLDAVVYCRQLLFEENVE